MKRLLAVVAAVAMIGGAWWVRQNVIAGDDSPGGDENLRLVCGPDLADVCHALAETDDSISVRVEPEAATAAALTRPDKSGTPPFDAWLTVGPWPAMVAEERTRLNIDGQVLATPTEVLARSPVTLVGRSDRVEALNAACGGTATWSCLGEQSGTPWAAAGGNASWGTVKAGLAPPDTGAGLVALDQAVADRTGRTDWDALDLDEATPWLGQLVGAATVTDDPLNVLLTRPGSFSFAAPLEQRSGPEIAGDRRPGFSSLYPEPVVTADVTLSAPTGADSNDVLERLGADRLREALATHGWRVRGEPSAPGVGGGPKLPASSGLASPGSLEALRNRWKELAS